MKDKINQFLDLNSSWFTNKSNSLFGYEKKARRALERYVKDKSFPKKDYNLIYIVGKFREFVS